MSSVVALEALDSSGRYGINDTYRLDELSVVQKSGLVFNVITRDPGLDLITEPLQFLDLRLQVSLQLLLLRLVCRRLHLVVYTLKQLDTLRYLLKGAVDFGYERQGP